MNGAEDIVFMVQFLEFYISYFARDTLYKISKVWGIYHRFHLTHPILIKPMTLPRVNFGVLQVRVSDSEGPKLLKYIRREVS